jgi:PTH2 family peptidyl-tRNA hydrolase
MNTKQVIVMRKDLKMRRGKEIAQGSHASMAFLTRRMQKVADHDTTKVVEIALTEVEQHWLDNSFAKVTVQVNSETELLEIEAKAKEAGIECHVVTDSGRTEFAGVPTKTCLALGPDVSEKIDQVTGNLSLY